MDAHERRSHHRDAHACVLSTTPPLPFSDPQCQNPIPRTQSQTQHPQVSSLSNKTSKLPSPISFDRLSPAMQEAAATARGYAMREAPSSSRRGVVAFQWQERPEEDHQEPVERDVAVDPFSLREFSQLDIDRPLPIPSVSVADRRRESPAARSPPGFPPRLSSDSGRLKIDSASSPLKPLAVAGGAKPELAGGEFDCVTVSPPEPKPSAPQRWGSDVPLIGAEDDDDSAGEARGKNGRATYARESPFKCCMYLPGRTRRAKLPVKAAARSPSSGTSIGIAAPVPDNDGPGTARPSTTSLAVSLERFDCGSLSTSSSPGALPGLDGRASTSSSCFDLPLELVLGFDDDDDETDLPVRTAFLFDSGGVRKSVLKRRLLQAAGAAPPRPSSGKVSTSTDASRRNSAHHVRFSVASRSSAASRSP
ncbi:hypothetical protein ACP4OV_016799 [Aristida adscensionis]